MEDWEDEHIPPVLTKEQPKSKWDDEDLDENDVKDSWEDEDEPAPEPARNPPAEKAPKKAAGKAAEKNVKTIETKEEPEPLDPVAEKLRQQRLVEEADYKSTKELFSKKGSDDKTLDNFIPKSESDFQEYAELISHRLLPFEKSFHYIGLLKAVMRLSMNSLKAADAKDVASSITAIANEKLKLEKEANAGKKKTGARKKQLHVDKPDDDLVVNAYDDVDDYDFIYSRRYHGIWKSSNQRIPDASEVSSLIPVDAV
ncbi:Eukaryotic translation initiation factor 3 subunit J [Trema orientale]|uniref:Eukaryotic translation initiation factor 3 subunit J n=1 Tax=Trema orientale TaxID=63057 RepID=A0A2P5EL37_TREOI|nr:Eukaryotic translation initiation factor 3 subunit J [Trema orientale]